MTKKIIRVVSSLFLLIFFVDIAHSNSAGKQITIDPFYHHLGESTFDSWLIPEPEGIIWESSFMCDRETIENATDAIANFYGYSISIADLIINGNRISLDDFGSMPTNQVFNAYRVRIPLSVIDIGENTIAIESLQYNPTDYDDLIIGEVGIFFQSLGCPPFVPGPDACTNPSCPCDEGQGDCDSHAECEPGLVCMHDVGANYGWPPSRDVCEQCPPFVPGPDACTPECQCSAGQGDCDSDDDCGLKLFCNHNVGTNYGWPPSRDVCEEHTKP